MTFQGVYYMITILVAVSLHDATWLSLKVNTAVVHSLLPRSQALLL